MSEVDFSKLAKKRQPTRREKARYRRWSKYLSNSRLPTEEIHKRAVAYTMQRKEPSHD